MSGVTQYREVERKVRVSATFVLPRLAGAVDGVARVVPGGVVHLLAAYHDTPDLRLIRWGATLRRREGGFDEGWHLKLPVEGAGPGVRDELGLPLAAGALGEVPPELVDIVRALVREARLMHLATVRTERTPFVLLDAAGREVAELVDDRVSVLEGTEVVRTFREIEVEARSGVGAAEVLDGVVGALISAGATPGTQGKAAAAIGPRAGGAPDVVVPPWPGPDGPAGDAVRCVISSLARRFLLQDVRVRRALPDSVHQMRVAARRLRSALRVFGPLVDADWADGLRAELGWAAGQLGLVRDTEVLLGRLDSGAAGLEPMDRDRARAAVDPWLRARLDAARADALAAMRSERYLAVLMNVVDAAANPALSEAAAAPAGSALAPLVDHAWRAFAHDVRRLERGGPATSWHRARISAKRARYAADAVAPVLGAPATALAEALARVTDLLGDHHDAWVAQETLRAAAALPGVDGPMGRALGLLEASEAARERADRARFVKLWPKVRALHKANPLH